MYLSDVVVTCLLGLTSTITLRSANAAPVAGPFDETLQARGLLGSYFGQVSITASYNYIVIGGVLLD